MKLLLDFLPIILFFATFKYAGADKAWASDFATQHLGFMVAGGRVGPEEAPVMLATAVVILATLAQVAWLKLRGRSVDYMLWVSLGLVVVLGVLTIYFHNETFIKWKPSGLYWALGVSFWVSQTLFGRNLVRLMLGKQITLPDFVWRRLNFAWVAFFGFMGLLNIWVAYTFTTDTWVNFKLFGLTGLLFIFVLSQGLYLSKYLEDEPDGEVKPSASGASEGKPPAA